MSTLYQRLRLSSPWAGNGTKATPYHPKFLDDYPATLAAHNITGTPPVGSCQLDADLDQATYNAVMADPNYNTSTQPLGVP